MRKPFKRDQPPPVGYDTTRHATRESPGPLVRVHEPPEMNPIFASLFHFTSFLLPVVAACGPLPVGSKPRAGSDRGRGRGTDG
jgi:hypothetical protein